MRLLAIPLVACAGAVAPPAHAQCQGPTLNAGQITALVLNKLVCGRAVVPGYPGSPADRFQEEHLGTSVGGAIVDFKLGLNHPVDPRKVMGQWSTTTTQVDNVPRGTITHNYGPVSFTWLVYGPSPQSNPPASATWSFCTATAAPVEHVRAHVVAINSSVGCNGVYPP